MYIEGFPPLARPDARVLVLGSMPSVASLAAREYYGHPRNAFWRIVGEIYRFEATIPYEMRVTLLNNAGLAVWDVLNCCVRAGSLDSAIQHEGIVPNSFSHFFDTHSGIKRVCFNGAQSAMLFKRYVMPSLATPHRYEWRVLPSTSPAYAAMSFEKKLAVWRASI
jgi:TDG/mug DNA glycosylase family protein